MPQLHFSVDGATAEELRLRAQQSGLTVSKFIARLVRRQLGQGWPDGYLESVVGACRDEPIEEPPELALRPMDL